MQMRIMRLKSSPSQGSSLERETIKNKFVFGTNVPCDNHVGKVILLVGASGAGEYKLTEYPNLHISWSHVPFYFCREEYNCQCYGESHERRELG